MRRLVLFALGCFACLSIGIGGARAQDTQWTLIETSGAVLIAQPLAAPRLVSLQEKLAPGSTLTTGGTGRAVVRRGAQHITVGPNSRIALPAAADGGMTRIIQDFGAAMFKVDKRGVQHFEVDTPMIAAVVKGTTFTVSVTAAGHSVHVTEGLVEVSLRAGGAPVPVPAGATAVVSPNNPAVIDLRAPGGDGRGPTTDIIPSTDRTASAPSTQTVASVAIPNAIGAEPLNFEALSNGLVKSGRTPADATPVAGVQVNDVSNKAAVALQEVAALDRVTAVDIGNNNAAGIAVSANENGNAAGGAASGKGNGNVAGIAVSVNENGNGAGLEASVKGNGNVAGIAVNANENGNVAGGLVNGNVNGNVAGGAASGNINGNVAGGLANGNGNGNVAGGLVNGIGNVAGGLVNGNGNAASDAAAGAIVASRKAGGRAN